MTGILMTELVDDYGADPGTGFWVNENASISITINKKRASLDDVIAQAKTSNFEIMVIAKSDRAINAENIKGGRISFSLPSTLFMRVIGENESEKRFTNLAPHIHEMSAQRAPGKHVRLSLRPDLTDIEIADAIKALYDEPILIRLVYGQQPSTRRLWFRVAASNAWVIDQAEQAI
jgi:hypothetical protein